MIKNLSDMYNIRDICIRPLDVAAGTVTASVGGVDAWSRSVSILRTDRTLNRAERFAGCMMPANDVWTEDMLYGFGTSSTMVLEDI